METPNNFGYIAVNDNFVHVSAAARDWSDGNTAAHVEYNRAALAAATKPFFVVVDAAGMPASAMLHVGFFRSLCALARNEFRGQLGGCTVRAAPYAVRLLYGSLVACGVVPAETAKKVAFED